MFGIGALENGVFPYRPRIAHNMGVGPFGPRRKKVSFVKKVLIRLLRTPTLFPLAKGIKDWMLCRTQQGKEHRERFLQFYAGFVASGDLCFDVGASVGNRTRIFRQLGARVVCVEPQIHSARILKRLFRNERDVTILCCALGEREGSGEIAICPDSPEVSSMSKAWIESGRFSRSYDWSERQHVDVTTLDALIAKHGVPVFCKIDVEGFELPVIRGLSQPIPNLSFEFCRERLTDSEKAAEYLSSLGNAAFNYSPGESLDLALTPWVSSTELCDKLRTADDPGLWGDIYARFE